MQMRIQLRNGRLWYHFTFLNNRQNGHKAIQIHHPTALSPFAALSFEISVDLVKPMQFMRHFDSLIVLVVKALLDFEIISASFIE